MSLKELFRAVNVQRMRLNLPFITEERFLEEITIMQLLGKLELLDGKVRAK